MASKSETMTVPSLEKLFEDYVRTAHETFQAMEVEFGFGGLVKQFLGGDYPRSIFHSENLPKFVSLHIQNSHAWKQLAELYEFAINGLASDEDTMYVATNAAEILSLASYDQFSMHHAWERLVWQADGRHGLDNGYPMEYQKLAYLADVDIRTVRNAVSAGQLVSSKTQGTDFIENESARKWLSGRRGFKPTVYAGQTEVSLANVNSPIAFGAILKAQRARIVEAGGTLTTQHPALTETVLNTLETGVFDLSLNMINPVADYYQIERKQFLSSVMRTFFPEQLAAIQSLSGLN
jgi:hypothetical protein